MDLIKFSVHDQLELKKEHPCGNRIFDCLRTGTDIRIRCVACGRDLTLPRLKLEKMIKKVIPLEQEV